MFALRQPAFQPKPIRFKPRAKKVVTKSYYALDYDNSKALEKVSGHDLFHVLAFHKVGHEKEFIPLRIEMKTTSLNILLSLS